MTPPMPSERATCRIAASPMANAGPVSTGSDTFVFAPGNGGGVIHDFRQSDHDRINVSAYDFTSLADMTITFDGANTRFDFDANNSVTLVGFIDPGALHPSDSCLLDQRRGLAGMRE